MTSTELENRLEEYAREHVPKYIGSHQVCETEKLSKPFP